ncbi:MAG: orotidine-5'-phosphate decarboxylase [Clostridiaceae bacterium]
MKDVIVALDFKNKEEAFKFLKNFEESIFVKIGMELFYSEGPEIVREIKEMGHQIFLDLKFHDIPNTVAGAMRSCLSLGVDMINLHASGGSKMMEAAMEEAKKAEKMPLVIAVTVLTSMDEKTMREELHVVSSVEEAVLNYAKLTQKSGLQGIVCSALEVKKIKEVMGLDFITVTPGIRPLDSTAGDQSRVVTPAMAREFGSDYIVVGRPITKAENPREAYEKIKNEFLGGLN